MINPTVTIQSDHIMVMLKKETLDHLRSYLVSQGDTTTSYDDVICEWVNWQIKAHEETKEQE
jgi:hypothetical protein